MAILILDNLSNVIFDDPINPRGELSFSGEAEVECSYNYEAEGVIAFALNGFEVSVTDELVATFLWALGEGPAYFYRIVGKCKPAATAPVAVPGCSGLNYTFITNIYARSLADVCSKLQKQYFDFPISSIQRFKRPPATSDFTSSTDIHNNELEDVTPPDDFSPCADLFVDYNATVPIKMSFRAFMDILNYEASGSLLFLGDNGSPGDSSYDGVNGPGLSGSAGVLLHNFAFSCQATGGLNLSGKSGVGSSAWIYSGSGSLLLTGLSRWMSSAITAASGGILVLSGSSNNLLENGGGGTAGFSGSAGVTWSARYQPSGALHFTGTAGVQTSLKEGSGSLSFTGSAGVTSSEQGIKVFNQGGSAFVVSQAIEFAFDNSGILLSPTLTSIVTSCCPNTLPQRLRLTHQLAASNYFKRFLQRNNVTINSPLDLFYNLNEVGWYSTLHFQGFAPDFPTIEQWTLTFAFQCVNSDVSVATPLLGTYWNFTFMASLRSVTNPGSPQRVTKLGAGFDASKVCFNAKPLNFIFDVNTQTGQAVPATVQSFVFVDDIGMFKSPAFTAKPTIRFKISELAVDIPPVVVDVGPAVVSAKHVGSSISGNKPATIPVG